MALALLHVNDLQKKALMLLWQILMKLLVKNKKRYSNQKNWM